MIPAFSATVCPRTGKELGGKWRKKIFDMKNRTGFFGTRKLIQEPARGRMTRQQMAVPECGPVPAPVEPGGGVDPGTDEAEVVDAPEGRAARADDPRAGAVLVPGLPGDGRDATRSQLFADAAHRHGLGDAASADGTVDAALADWF